MKYIFLKIIYLYKKILSPFLHYLIPSLGCDFTYQAIKKYGIFKGGFKGLKRILKCHPFSKGGYDPL